MGASGRTRIGQGDVKSRDRVASCGSANPDGFDSRARPERCLSLHPLNHSS